MEQALVEQIPMTTVEATGTRAKGVFTVKFWGTRGSIATPGAATVRYGGNTSCVEIRCGEYIFIFDCGTGVRELGIELANEFATKRLELHMFVSHTHWDHIQGFPFFGPAYKPGNIINIYSLQSPDRNLSKLFTGQMDLNYFPVTLEELLADLNFYELASQVINIGPVRITNMPLNHPGVSIAFRLECAGKSIVYMTDHEPYSTLLGESPRTRQLDEQVDAFAKGADLYIREAQYTDSEYHSKKGWGHSALSDVVDSAVNANVKKVALFHHDPMHDDVQIDTMVQFCRDSIETKGSSIEVFAANDRMTIEV